MPRQNDTQRRAFTLIELLVVIAIIAIIGGITIFAVGRLAKDARRVGATNAVMAVLDNARSTAIRENRIVAVVFRARFGDGDSEYTEAVLCKWTGEVYRVQSGFSGGTTFADRYVPIPGIPPRRLPEGFKVAGAMYGLLLPGDQGIAEEDLDLLWAPQTTLSAISQDPSSPGGEAGGAIITVFYNARGERIMTNPESDSVVGFVDWDGNFRVPGGGMRREGMDEPLQAQNLMPIDTSFSLQVYEDDEPYIYPTPFLSVYDENEARELYNTATWVNAVQRRADYSDYINERADRIHFNRYSGVAMR
ncbi:MAG: prepilin-type N-terminal cleavage/methylation domain-containing protein [Planctomycetota bacterium]